MLVDSHCHLNFPQFSDDFEDVLQRCKENGVGFLQTICTHMDEFDAIYAIADAHDWIYCSAGVHPCHVKDGPLVDAQTLRDKAKLPKVIGLGETGLDYFHDDSNKADQQESFRTHMRVAIETGLPVIIHTRDAEADTMALLKEMRQEGDFPALIHCFSASYDLARECLDMGIYLSIPGIVTFKNATELHDNVGKIPLDRMLVETDSPYLAPAPHRGKRNEPGFVRHTAERVAELKGVEPTEVARITSDNFFTLFSKAPREAALDVHG